MKLYIMLLLGSLPLVLLQAQNKFELKSLNDREVLQRYATRDDAGNSLELITAIQVSLHQKECDTTGIPLYLKGDGKKEYTRPALYCWNSLSQRWTKSVGLTKSFEKGMAIYSAKVRCPGIYAFLDQHPVTEKGVQIVLPSKCAIRSVRLIQQEPACAIFWDGKGSHELKLPFGPLQFDAVLEISWEEGGTLKQASYLCGAITRIEETPESGTFRKLEIKPEKSQEFQSSLFTTNTH
jgi:hypothetical protein